MNNTAFTKWCNRATALIRYGPDRHAVAAELQAHLEDHFDLLVAGGMSPAEAEETALAAMGDAKEIAPQLEAVHKPWLGYLYSAVRFAAITLTVFALLSWGTVSINLLHTMITTHNFESLPANFGPLDYYCQPDVADSSDGYRFQITEAGYSEAEAELYLELRTTHWPWLGTTGISNYFRAVDSLGNEYASHAESDYGDVPSLSYHSGSYSAYISHSNLVLKHFDCKAQWVELYYNRDGRDIVLHIDLSGGDGA